MRRAVNVKPMVATLEKRVADLGHPAVQRHMPCELNRCFGLVSISSAGALKFEAAVIRDIYLLVRVIDQKSICTQTEAAEIG
jgi:hypothetical protein